MANTNKQLTSEEKNLLQKEAEKNNLSEEEIEDVENILKATGGMSEGAQKAFIGILTAVSGAALGTGVTYAIMKHNKKSNNDQQNCVTIKLPLGESPNGSSSNPENGADSRNLVSQLLSNLSPENRAAISNTKEGAALLELFGNK